MKELWHRRDEDRYKYKRFRKGNEQVEAWWLDPPLSGHSERRGRRYDHDWYYSNNNLYNPRWQHSADHYPYPPPHRGSRDRDFWWYGDNEAPWRKERGYWENGKYVPIDVANLVQEKLGKEVELLRSEMNSRETNL